MRVGIVARENDLVNLDWFQEELEDNGHEVVINPTEDVVIDAAIAFGFGLFTGVEKRINQLNDENIPVIYLLTIYTHMEEREGLLRIIENTSDDAQPEPVMEILAQMVTGLASVEN